MCTLTHEEIKELLALLGELPINNPVKYLMIVQELTRRLLVKLQEQPEDRQHGDIHGGESR